jgi:hypothetical protein
MATREEKIAHAKQERLCGIVCWMNGGPRGHELDPRWSGDDGRIVENPEIMWMRLLLLEGNLTFEKTTVFQKIIDAEQTEWEKLDAIYENIKSTAVDD